MVLAVSDLTMPQRGWRAMLSSECRSGESHHQQTAQCSIAGRCTLHVLNSLYFFATTRYLETVRAHASRAAAAWWRTQGVLQPSCSRVMIKRAAAKPGELGTLLQVRTAPCTTSVNGDASQPKILLAFALGEACNAGGIAQ